MKATRNISGESDWPTTDDWRELPATAHDLIFENDHDLMSAYAPQFERLQEIAEDSQATRSSVIDRLFELAQSRVGMIHSVRFDHLMPMADDNYQIPEGETEGFSTFKAVIEVGKMEAYPKLAFDQVTVTDFVIPGLDAPWSISVKFDRSSIGGGCPWILNATPPYPVIQVRSGDNELPVVIPNNMSHIADAESIEQTLKFMADITEEILGSSPAHDRAHDVHTGNQPPRFRPLK